MGLSLRIDVDNPFGYATTFKKILNRISLDYDLIPKWKKLGYLEPALKLCQYLEDREIPTTWFFRNETAPNAKDMDKFRTNLNSIALHAESTDSFSNFAKEVTQWSGKFGIRPKGFSKHGSGDMKLSRKHVMEYEPEKFIEFAKRAKMDFFIGNGTDLSLKIENHSGVIYIPSVYWIDRPEYHGTDFTIKQLVEYSKVNHIVAILHPDWWFTKPEVRKNFEKIICSTTFSPLSEIMHE